MRLHIDGGRVVLDGEGVSVWYEYTFDLTSYPLSELRPGVGAEFDAICTVDVYDSCAPAKIRIATYSPHSGIRIRPTSFAAPPRTSDFCACGASLEYAAPDVTACYSCRCV